ncbi:hypothetical protein [Microbacterium gallinarum]|jgi:hypothetical protein|uniref:DUF3558 domain-containing protein n=1 Tax=Microbacterium gallinarum TaxID=2762209 RepID=A0ABR8X748_9MICO|nr:hypothetical protein [Microbacterium gallinarum]MBD8024621.1 hypothetical protein [Microbacterium gallinarum]
MAHRTSRLAAAAASLVLAVAVLSACAAEATGGAGPTPTSQAETTEATPIPTVTASPTPTVQADIPDDCRAILNASVLAELADVPLNDPAFGPSGLQNDGSLICVWRDPAADTTSLVTTITYVSRGPALDLLNGLADDEDFTCYTPDGGTRCEKTWENETYPVTDGRTLFWRDGILIDTQFSNLAPAGYTSAIVTSIFG